MVDGGEVAVCIVCGCLVEGATICSGCARQVLKLGVSVEWLADRKKHDVAVLKQARKQGLVPEAERRRQRRGGRARLDDL